MNLVTKKEVARLAGVTGAAVTKAVSSGRLRERARKIDLDDDLTKQFIAGTSSTGFRPGGKRGSRKRLAELPADRTELEILKLKQQVLHLRLKNEEKSSGLVSRENVERCILDPINTCHMRILSDGATSIAAHIHPLIKGGASVESAENYIRVQIEGFIKAAKRDMKKFMESRKAEDDIDPYE